MRPDEDTTDAEAHGKEDGNRIETSDSDELPRRTRRTRMLPMPRFIGKRKKLLLGPATATRKHTYGGDQ